MNVRDKETINVNILLISISNYSLCHVYCIIIHGNSSLLYCINNAKGFALCHYIIIARQGLVSSLLVYIHM